MFDRKQYDLDMDKARKEQISEIADYLSEYIKVNADIRDMPVCDMPDDALIEEIKNMPIPQKGRNSKEVGDEIVEKILSKSMLLQHPRYLSLVCCAVSPYSLAGSVLADIYNVNVAGHGFAPAVSIIEEKLVSYMGSLAGFDPKKCGGVFTSGGSVSNLTGMIAARENKLIGRVGIEKGVAYCSDQAHSSVRKGMRMMGLRDDQIQIIPSDDEFRIDLDVLKATIKADLAKGMRPFLIVGCLGSTNTGSIDPLNELADICEKYDMWLHVDGAYGGSILFSEIYRNLAKGVERADSLSWDTHKWSQQVYSCSTIIAKDKQTFITAFNEHPEYLADTRVAEYNDGWDLGIEMSRPARCIKLWYTIQAMGTDLLADVIDYSFYNAKLAYNKFLELPGWEIISKPCCGALTFRYAPENVAPEFYDELNNRISSEIISDGYAYVITTTLKEKKVLRFCLINGNTTAEDVLNTIEKLDDIAHKLEKEY